MFDKEKKYLIENAIERIYNGLDTKFFNEVEYKYISNILNKKKIEYKVFIAYPGCSNYSFYLNDTKVNIFEIICDNSLNHSSILGSLLSLNIDINFIGDIMIGDKYYFVIKSDIYDDVINNFNRVGKYNIKLKEVKLEDISYEQKYQEIQVVVPSERIDVIISRGLNINRKYIDKMILDGYILINYQELKNRSYLLKKDDIFSVRKYGKYIYDGIIKITKKGGLVVSLKKYV